MPIERIHLAFAASILLHATVLLLRAPTAPLEDLSVEAPRLNAKLRLDVFLEPVRPVIPAPEIALVPVVPPAPAAKPSQESAKALLALPHGPAQRKAPPATFVQTPSEPLPKMSAEGADPARPLDVAALKDQIVAAYLGTPPPSLSADTTRRGGVFRIKRVVGDDYAELFFAGWNPDAGHNTADVYTVRRRDAPNIRVAVVRRAIGIIRDRWSGDFEWVSQRLRKSVMLSARPQDNQSLEDFLLLEFFVGDQPANWDRPG
ncbi:MAG: hypothetical protein JO035_16945 [Betaproteobacteria bacterium]|nr:hypothetical protein [Betaproteobacteria bacterium]